MHKKTFLLALIALSLFACSKSVTENPDKGSGLPSSSETKPQYDNTNFGVYKGVIVGSSGYITFRINNGDNNVRGYLQIDNQKDTLITDASLTLGQPINNILFTGKISSMKISANADGSDAKLTDIQINGHTNVTGHIIHEKSDNQVLCYEGTFNGTATGILNATRLANGDTTFLLAKMYQETKNGVLVNMNSDTLYLGYGWNSADSISSGYLKGWIQHTTFNISGKFSNSNNTTPTFNGTWTGYFGNGEFTTKRTY